MTPSLSTLLALLVAGNGWAGFGSVPQDADPQEPPGSSLTVHLLTAQPGDRVWELFGHNALLVRDSISGFEAAYNYGLFDLFEDGFVIRFLQGEMMYAVGPMRLAGMLEGYRADNRRVWAQELDLEPEARAELLELLRTASLPENRRYRYEYFLNNCSTKLRDALDQVLRGQLESATRSGPTSSTWRTHTRRLTAPSAFGYLGIQLLLGPKGDEATTPWDDMWVPMKLRDTVAGMTYTKRDGSVVPLVRSEELWAASTRPDELTVPPPFNPLFLLVGLAAGLLIVLLGDRANAGSAPGRVVLGLIGTVWGAFCFATGLLLILVHWTDHEFMYWNQNVLLFSPIGMALMVLIPAAAWRVGTGVWTRRLAGASVGLSVVALVLRLIPPAAQGNAEWIALALPLHVAVWWVLVKILPAQDRLKYA